MTLDDCLQYEIMLKKFIVNLEDREEQLELNRFKESNESDKANNVVEFWECKDKDMLPMMYLIQV